MTTALIEPVHDLLVAQAINLSRIVTGLVIEGTTGTGEQIILHGPGPDVIRLYDEPLRLIQMSRLSAWQRIITINPVGTGPPPPEASITRRDDKIVHYQVDFYVRLTDAEMQHDREAILESDPFRASNQLAEKLHKLLSDFHHVFRDNDLLTTDECPRGVTNWQSYDLAWSERVRYPEAMAHAIVEAHVNAW